LSEDARASKNRPNKSYLSKFDESTELVNSFSAAPSNPRAYMKIIKESPRLKQRRMDLKDQKRELLRMEFDTRRQRQSEMVQFINKFMHDRTIQDSNSRLPEFSGLIGEVCGGPKKAAFVKTVYKPV
jgi:hypothetical protein